jgi:IPT/TIG domain
MTFYPNLWLATATAAPVIALAAIVSIGENLRSAARGFAGVIVLAVAGLLSILNILLQGVVLFFSLQSLMNNDNAVIPELIISFAVLGLFLIAAATVMNAIAAWTLYEGPVVNDVNPKSGSAAGGERVTLTGKGLFTTTQVKFGTAYAETDDFDRASDDRLIVTSPSGNVGEKVHITVQTTRGVSHASAFDEFGYVTAASP